MKTILLLILSVFCISCSTEKEVYYKIHEITYAENSYEEQVLEAINIAREVNGLQPLKPELEVTNGAISHAEYMDSHKVCNHAYFQDRADASHAERFGEIATYNYITPLSQVGAILGSQPHRMILLGDYTHCGISFKGKYLCIDMAKYGANNNKKVITQKAILINQ